jgi:hypothetical protein
MTAPLSRTPQRQPRTQLMEMIHPVTDHKTKLTPAQDTPRAEPHDNRPQYVRRREAARFLGLSYGTLSNWASAGRGPSFHRLGGGKVVLYAIEELTRFAEAGRVEMRAA